MNYLLVMPRKLSVGASTFSVIFPLGLAYVSASLKEAGFNVHTLNMDLVEGDDTDSILQETIRTHNIDVICTGGLSLDCLKIIHVIDIAKEINPEIISVVGGGIISSDPETAMNVIKPDMGVIGEGEATICELAQALDDNETYDEIPGLIFRNGDGEWHITSKRKEIRDVDSIPIPDFDGFGYEKWLNLYGGSGILLSDRSCPYRCTFCFHPTGEKYRQRSLDSIFAELDFQLKHYPVKSVGLTSELFAYKRERIMEFCDRIEPYHLNWSCCLRVTDVDADILSRMRETGCSLICYGLESGDDSVLKSMRKNITSKQIEHALDLTIDAQISTEDSNFIFGDINETKETIENTLKLWHRYYKKTHINLTLIQTFPGTVLYQYAVEKGIIENKEQFLLDGCPIINVSTLTEEEFRDLKSTILELQLYHHVPAESLDILSVDKDGCCAVEYSCRACGTRNQTETWFWFTKTCFCTSCGLKNEVDAYLKASHDEDLFNASIPSSDLIGMWGSGGIFYKLIKKYPRLASEKTILLDTHPDRQGLSLCGKKIYNPETISLKKIETILVTALSHQKEIVGILSENFPSVKTIVIPAIHVSGKRIIPMLKKLESDDLCSHLQYPFSVACSSDFNVKKGSASAFGVDK